MGALAGGRATAAAGGATAGGLANAGGMGGRGGAAGGAAGGAPGMGRAKGADVGEPPSDGACGTAGGRAANAGRAAAGGAGGAGGAPGAGRGVAAKGAGGATGRGGNCPPMLGVIAGVGALPKCIGGDTAVAGAGARPAVDGSNSSAKAPSRETVITPPHTEQRARTSAGTFAGSTRKTEEHSGHATFTDPPSVRRRRPARPERPAPDWRRCGDRRKIPIPEAFSRSSSFQWRVR